MEPYWEDLELEAKLIDALISQSKPGRMYRIFLGVSGTLLFITGLLIWNIPLNSPDDPRLLGSLNAAIGAEWDWFLFSLGLFLNLIVGPYFAFISLSQRGRLIPLHPKEVREYYGLKNSIKNKEIHDHYWAALKDPTHEHHNDVIRYKWMDKIQWKHRPNDFFGRMIYTELSGEELEGPIVPKTSPEYLNTNVIYDENNNPIGTDSPFTHPTRYLFTIPNLLAAISLASLPYLSTLAILSGDLYAFLDVFKQLATAIVFGAVYTLWRNTHLFDSVLGKENYELMSVEVLEGRLILLQKKYVIGLEIERDNAPN